MKNSSPVRLVSLNPDTGLWDFVDDGNPLPVDIPSGVSIESGSQSVVNTTVTPLGASSTFTGGGEQNNFNQTGIYGRADQDGTLFFEHSVDGVTWFSFPTAGFVISANIPFFRVAVKLGRFFRPRFVNGSIAQGSFFLYTYYGNNFVPANSPLNQIISTDSDAITVKSVAEESISNVRALLTRSSINTTTYGILVDLSDTVNFPHDNTNRIDISLLKIAIDPSSNSVGDVDIGVITRIDGTNADILFGFVVPFGQSGSSRILSINNFSPSQLKFGVTAGVWDFGITNVSATNVAAVNTGVTLDSPRGVNTVTPAVGDVIIRYLHTSGSAWDALVETFYHSH